ncbi:6-carboxytetrahydropterin synthase [Streptomyces sp. PTM05]|uniref:6-carboxy-5,6,7,8-tetrahydropterin synthase n=1 Tax=Streptantibioticus parmotrematis TaxID=2873249 RepID=A0ABS7QNP2_9ACTN|nr:6-carboxytetrahydropterin synthase [Streptantibioticus parmotrematis]MBY8884770.1 6-carboxytetrahydropterin synthase [Streptantibioticus parmotrematis]
MAGALTITKEFHFSASHLLDKLPAWHQCARPHGHNYIVVMELSAAPDALSEAGFVRDYGELDTFKKWVDETLDHRHLNDIVAFSPSAELLALWIYSQWAEEYPDLVAVWISETPKTWAIYRGTGPF